ncbi:MAG: hypothetical protein ACI9UK_002274 [Candidatus Krumholzibacteriia bacterium]|jgi:uncharacterized protein (DUF2237 family)
MKQMPMNVLGTELVECGRDPVTGFYRTGCCETGADDHGHHLVCIEATEEFLIFSAERGNDLATPMQEFGFPGILPGDRWCLCAERWQEAFEADMAPPVHLEATHILTLEFIDLADLQKHAVSTPSG